MNKTASRAHAHARARAHAHARTHAHTHTHARTRAHPHTTNGSAVCATRDVRHVRGVCVCVCVCACVCGVRVWRARACVRACVRVRATPCWSRVCVMRAWWRRGRGRRFRGGVTSCVPPARASSPLALPRLTLSRVVVVAAAVVARARVGGMARGVMTMRDDTRVRRPWCDDTCGVVVVVVSCVV